MRLKKCPLLTRMFVGVIKYSRSLSSQLVLGDIVLLEAGDVVPADLRLVESANLKIEESALTGESVPVDKTSEPLTGADVGIGDRPTWPS